MQTTLLSLAIALILALLAALVGPYLVDWTRYQAEIEARATDLLGAPVEISGPIVVRLLPTPSLALHSVAVTAGETNFSTRSIRMELALGPLLRGELQVSELQLSEPRLRLGLDRTGALSPLPAAVGVDPDRLAIDRLAIDDGRLTFSDAASGRSLAVEKLFFAGELRSLIGPLRGEGRFTTGGASYAFRLGSSRASDHEIKLRFGLDAPQWPLIAETDATVSFRDAKPRLEGSVTLTGPASAVRPDGRAVARDPWKATAHARLDASQVGLEDLELNYGPEDRLLRFTGQAQATFGATPRFAATLTGRQVVLDRLVAGPSPTPGQPLLGLAAVLQDLLKSKAPDLPGEVEFSSDQMSFAGSALQNVHAKATAGPAGWAVTALDFRAPGATQIGLGGQLRAGTTGLSHAGPVSFVSSDPGAFVTFLRGKADPERAPIPPASLTAEMTLNDGAFTLDRLRAEIDGKPIEGRLAYSPARPDHPARLDATLNAAEIDLDNAIAIGKGALAGSRPEWPQEIALALRISRVTYAGVDAGRVDTKLKLDGSGLTIERLAIGELRGASIQASGQIDTAAASPQGSVTLALTAARPEGVLALLSRAAPQTADALGRYAAQLGATDLRGRFDIAPATAASPGAAPAAQTSEAKLTLNGTLGAVRINLSGTALGNKKVLEQTRVKLTGSLEAADGRVLAAIAGVNRLVAIDERPALVTLAAEGPLDGAVNCDLRLASGGLSTTATGMLRLAKGEWSGKGDVSLAATDARLLFDPAAAAALPVALDGRLAFSGQALSVDGLKGRFAGADVTGRLAFNFIAPVSVDGRLDTTDLDAASLIAVALAAPRVAPEKSRPAASAVPAAADAQAPKWSAEPFRNPLLTGLRGRVAFTSARATLLPGVQAHGVKGSVHFDGPTFAVEQFSGSVADGAVAASASFQYGAAGLALQAKLSAANVNLAQIAFGRGQPPATGTLSFSADLQGSGRSPAALIGSLSGKGSLAIEGMQLAGLDAQAIEATLVAAERGLALDRLPDYLARTLDNGMLTVARGETRIDIVDGRIQVAPLLVHPDGAQIVLSGALNLATSAVDARFTLAGRARPEMEGRRPEVSVVLQGPIEAPVRSVDTASFLSFATQQAVEREEGRVKAAEREAKRREAAAAERARIERDARQRADEAKRADEARRAEEERRARPAPADVAAPVPQRSATAPPPAPAPLRNSPAPEKTPPAAAAPALPPPIEIRPPVQLPVQNAPLPRRRPTEAARAPERDRPPENPSPPPPPPSRTLWDFLFHNP